MSLSTHAPPIVVLGLDAGTLARKQRRVLIRGSHEQQQGGQPNNGLITKDHSNRPQQTPQQPWPELPLICAACKILANPAPRGMGMPALCLKVCSHPDPPSERDAVRHIIAGLPSGDSDPIALSDIKQGIARRKKGTSPGLDNWTTEAIQRIPDCALHTLLHLYQYIEATGRWPPQLLRTKITLLLKPGQDGSLPCYWRPLAVTSLWYRLYGQVSHKFAYQLCCRKSCLGFPLVFSEEYLRRMRALNS